MARLAGNRSSAALIATTEDIAFADVAYTIKSGRIIYRAERK